MNDYLAASIVCVFLFGIIWQMQRKKANESKPNSSCDVVPVTYLGWQGTVHSFSFSNKNFSDRFQFSNIKKLLG